MRYSFYIVNNQREVASLELRRSHTSLLREEATLIRKILYYIGQTVHIYRVIKSMKLFSKKVKKITHDHVLLGLLNNILSIFCALADA